MKRFATQLTALAVTLALAAIPLAGCGSNTSSDQGAAEPSPAAAASQGTSIDTSSWKTMRDALAIADSDDISYGYDDKTFLCVFRSGEAYIRTRAEMQPEVQEKIYDLNMDDDDYRKKFMETIGDLELAEATDISSELMSQEDLEQYVGKTGQDLMDAGLTFASYFLYGGDQTGAEMDKGNFTYSIIFDAQISEEQTEDEGASITDAKVVEVQSMGNLSDAALNPISTE